MSEDENSGFIRLQTQSHVSASQWRQWTNVLGLDYRETENVWDEIGYPIFAITRQLPPIPQILQVRAERRWNTIHDFRDEIAPLWAIIYLLERLNDEMLVGDRTTESIFHFFRNHVTSQAGKNRCEALIEQFAIDLAKLILVAKLVAKETISLTEVVNIVTRKQLSVANVIDLGLQTLGTRPYAHICKSCLQGPSEPEELAGPADVADQGEESRNDQENTDGQKITSRYSPDALNSFILDFRKSLEEIYTEQSREKRNDEVFSEVDLLSMRLQALGEFDPLQATIPSPDEADQIVAKHMSSGSKGVPSNPSGQKTAPSQNMASSGRRSRSVQSSTSDPVVLRSPDKKSAKIDSLPNEDSRQTSDEVNRNLISPTHISTSDFNQKVHQVGRLLGAAERCDETVWQLFLNPESELENGQALADALADETNPVNQAYALIKAASQLIGLKKLLDLDDRPRRNLRFNTQISSFINIAQATQKTFQPDDRQLEGLAIILDHTVVTLLRLENLRINYLFASQRPDYYTPDAVAQYREKKCPPCNPSSTRPCSNRLLPRPMAIPPP